MSQYTRHIKPKEPETGLMKLWGYIGAGIAWLLFGVFMIFWNGISRNRFGVKKSAFRDLEDL